MEEEKDTITINLQSFKFLRKYFFKNSFVFIFSLLAFFALIFGISRYFNFSLGLNFLNQIVNLFSVSLWSFLVTTLVISSILAYYEKYKLMFIPIMVWLLFTTVVIRTSNMPGLVNAATGEPELGPDLDPFLFLRNAQEIAKGENLGKLDQMRYAPLGTPSYIRSSLEPWMIYSVYRIINLFGDYSVTQGAILSPVIFFIISIIGFFLFVYFSFSFKLSKKKALLGATIASFFYSFAPMMLHRTIAGIPESESGGMMWFWFAFLFFVLAWKQEFPKDKTKMIIYSLLAGLFTGLMSWTWGGYTYIYMTITLVALLGFLFNIEFKKNLLIFVSFLTTGLIIELTRPSINFISLINSFNDTGFALGVLILMSFNFILYETRIKNWAFLKKIKDKTRLPENISSILILIVLVFLIMLIARPFFIVDIFSKVINGLLYPFGRGRIGLTVAENRTPYFLEVLGNFGILIWLFLIGLIFIFYESIKHFKSKEKVYLNSFFILFILTFVFSRISQEHVFDGENFISKVMYLGGISIFGMVLLFIYLKSFIKKDERTFKDFSKINFSSIVLFVFAFWAIVSMRGAVRLFFIIAPTIILISVYFSIKILGYIKTKDELTKIFVWSIIIISYFILSISFLSYAQSTVSIAPRVTPGPYNEQWHHAMYWVSENTPKDAIFIHWWDYGYWVQTLGQRPTVSDGGHFIEWWDHTIGRYLLTAPKPETALSLMKTHNVSYLLIDSTDIGKYQAFSTIGSNKTGKDRRSWIPVIPLEPRQTLETENSTKIFFSGGTPLDTDIIYIGEEGNQIFLPQSRSWLAGISLEYTDQEGFISFSQPLGIFVYNNQRYDLPLKNLYYGEQLFDFGLGVNSTIKIIPGLSQTTQGLNINQMGAVMYFSEKTGDSLLVQLYLLKDVNQRYPTIKIAHVEDDFVVKNLKGQGVNVGEFVYFQGFRGPIKIWSIDYPEGILVQDEFLYPQKGWNQLEGPWATLDELEFIR